jgi:hypothetical protein
MTRTDSGEFDLDSQLSTVDGESTASLSRWFLEDNLASLTSVTKKQVSEGITIYIKCVFPDPANPGNMLQISRSQGCKSDDRVDSVVANFLQQEPDIPRQGKTYYLGYDQLLFREGTLADCGIIHGKSVELYSPGKTAAAYHNEGAAFVLWSLVPLVVGIACFLFTVTFKGSTEDSNSYNGLFLFLAFLLLIPSAVVLTLGLILIPECPMPCYFSGTEWW